MLPAQRTPATEARHPVPGAYSFAAMRDRRLIAVGGLVALAALVRFSTLDLQSFWYDEAVTVDLVRRSFTGMLREIPSSESTPPLYYVLAWCWAKVFGTGEVGLRSLSALFGTAAIPVFYAAAAELYSRRVALAVAALAAVNPFLVWYSQEARSYALLSLLGALSLLFFARLLRRAERRDLVLWALFSALALATHYFAVFLVAPEAAWLVARYRDRRAMLAAVTAVTAVAGALLPLALHQKGLDLTSFIRGRSLPYRLARVPKQYLVGFDSPLEVASSVLAVLIAGAGTVLSWLRLGAERGVRVATALAIFTVGAPFVLALAGVDYFDSRNLIASWLPFAVLVAAGLVVAGGRAGLAAFGAVVLLGLAGVIGVAVEPNWRRDDWRAAARALGPAREDRVVVITPAVGARPFQLYRRDTGPIGGARALVREIALISGPARGGRGVHPPSPPRPRRPVLPSGFRVIRREYAHTYTLIILRAPRPTALTSLGAQPYGLLKGGVAVLVQRAHAARGRPPGGG
jgi:mannosyltransferase